MASLLFVACQSDNYSIKGEARTFSDGTLLYLTTDLNGGQPFDSVYITDGHFAYFGTALPDSLCRLYAPAHPEVGILFFPTPGNIYIELSDKPARSRVSGTKVNNEWQALNDTVARYDARIRALFSRRDSISPHLKSVAMNQIYDTLNRRITEAALRNHDNALGRFISTHRPTTSQADRQ